MRDTPGERAQPKSPSIFVSDDAEGVRIADALRAVGYVVDPVALAELAARSQVDRPNVVLVDVDTDDALEQIARCRRIPGGASIDFVYVGSGGGPIRSTEDALSSEGSAFFPRPIDVGALLRRIESLTGGPAKHPDPRPSARSGLPPRRSSIPPERASTPSLPAPGLRTPGPPLPMSVPSLADLVDPPRSLATFGTVSNELQQLLAEAEQRAEGMPQPDKEAALPTPEEEIETVLPADVLASLDEPIEGDEDEEHEARVGTGVGDREGTGPAGKPTTAGGTKHTTSSGRSTSTPQTHERRPGTDSPTRERPLAGRRTTEEWQPPPAHAEGSTRAPAPSYAPAPIPEIIRTDGVPTLDTLPPSESAARGPSQAPAAAAVLGTVILRPVDARRFVADAIARRMSGAICFEHEGTVRRLVVRDGDLVTAASGDEDESLVAFLGARGELPREEADRLAGKIPPYGRHAGAALVAHGWLGQDQLWTTLRAHAEWIATSMLRLSSGTAQLEAEPPGRLRSEPSVFGASTGAEIFVELVRRAVSTDDAVEVLGGEASRIADGPMRSLLDECALAPAERELVARARGGTLGELLARSKDRELASVVHALALLGVLDIIPAVHPNVSPPAAVADAEAALLDDEAIRARIRARLALVDEGDYFSVLGVSREATSYEVRRAFLELRRAFEPSRILSPRLLDLEGDVRKIVVVLEEAYEILRDNARRERYRRAIDARPA